MMLMMVSFCEQQADRWSSHPKQYLRRARVPRSHPAHCSLCRAAVHGFEIHLLHLRTHPTCSHYTRLQMMPPVTPTRAEDWSAGAWRLNPPSTGRR
jgi:hypothetical protein